VTEQPLTLEDLDRADEVFITSTTRDLLPVIEIDGTRLNNSTDVQERLLIAFRSHVESYCCVKTAVQ
jgi:branched-subunit amino acid aminotransferase/4-amino-4-deoxychorismate lyase